MKGASGRPARSSHGTARVTIGSAQRRPTTRGTRYAALTKSGTPTVTVNTPRNVGVVCASSAGTAAAAQTIPSVFTAFATARTRPGLSSTLAAAPMPRNRYATQRLSSTWLTAAAATAIVAAAPANTRPRSSATKEAIIAARNRRV